MNRLTQPLDSDRHPLDALVSAHNHAGAAGMTSVCSAHPYVLEASLREAQAAGQPVLIESTCNQVNQYGGYTGMRPSDFARLVQETADAAGVPREQFILGGDHLGPSVWQQEPAAQAMVKACVLVQACVRAGYVKIHLDASMKCADDPADAPLDVRVSAARAAEMAAAAEREQHPAGTPPRYVIGTEVPPPGGIQGEDEAVRVTPPSEVEETIAVTRAAFLERGLEAAWERVIAVVVQPGVEYGDQTIHDYRPAEAQALSRCIEAYDNLIYEAHSTDYQTRHALQALVAGHFAIVKVGPALTFAFREAVFALALIEQELAPASGFEPSGVEDALEDAMLANPAFWQPYYTGSPAGQHLARRFSLSDRSRYYWPVPGVQQAFQRLLDNLAKRPIPSSLLSQFVPVQYAAIRQGALASHPRAIIMDAVARVLHDYLTACNPAGPRPANIER